MSAFFSASVRRPVRGSVTHGYLEGHRPVFVSFRQPADQIRRIGLVVCPPLGWEAVQSYHSLRVLGERLAKAGFPTITLNYDGTGESPGSDEDPGRVDAWLSSIRRAVAAMSQVEGVDSVGLIGLRIGATLAARATSEVRVSHLVLWEPFLGGQQYTRELTILAAGAQSRDRVSGAVGPEADRIEATGHILSGETVQGLNSIHLETLRPMGTPDVLIVSRSDLPSPSGARLQKCLIEFGCNVTLQKLPGFKEMMTYPERSEPPIIAMERICEWLIERTPVEQGKAPFVGPCKLAEHATVDGVRRWPVRFGPDSRIFGVVSEPEKGALDLHKPAVLLLTGGLVPRTAVNGMYKELARSLAKLGHCVLRMDVSGIGESLSPAEGMPANPHAPWLLEDATCASTALFSHTRADRLWVIGLCSGAYAAYQLARSDSRVAGAILINPADLRLSLGSSLPSHAQQVQDAKRYFASIYSVSTWMKLFQGRLHMLDFVAFLNARAWASLMKFRDRVISRFARIPVGLAEELHVLLKRGSRISIVLSDGDIGQQVLQEQIGDDMDALRKQGLNQVVFQNADHTFNQFPARQSLLGWILEEVSRSGKPRKARHRV